MVETRRLSLEQIAQVFDSGNARKHSIQLAKQLKSVEREQRALAKEQRA